jgi:competence protein ComEA
MQTTVLLVHVLGAVAKPGIVELRAGSRVVDAIAAAGGLAADADASGVNLARVVSDGEQLVVPREGEAVAPPAGATGAAQPGAAAGALVNVNAASASDLQTLPRIGPALAQRIVDWRDAHGRFTAPADLMKVSGIGQTLFDGLKDLITL